MCKIQVYFRKIFILAESTRLRSSQLLKVADVTFKFKQTKYLQMLHYHRIFCIALLFICITCKTESQTISKISCQGGGGELGIYVGIDITKDSIATYYQNVHENTIFRKKIKNTFWDSLTHNINYEDLKAVKSTKSTAYIDDPDSFIVIETSGGKFSFLNAVVEDKTNKKMLSFLAKLEEEQRKIYEKYQ